MRARGITQRVLYFQYATQPARIDPCGPAARLISMTRHGTIRKVGRPRARVDAEDTAEVLKRSAFELVSVRGTGAVTIKEIGDKAGVTTAMIYYYFKDKDDLISTSIEYAIDQAFEHFRILSRDDDDPAARIRKWLRTHVEQVGALSRMMRLSIDSKLTATRSARIDAAIARFYETERSLLTDCVRRGITDGIFSTASPAQVSDLISTFLDGAMVRARIVDGFDVAASVETFEGLLWRKLGYETGHATA